MDIGKIKSPGEFFKQNSPGLLSLRVYSILLYCTLPLGPDISKTGTLDSIFVLLMMRTVILFDSNEYL